MPSGGRRKRPDEPPVFFVDRSLGRHIVPEVFRSAGFEVVLMAEVWPETEQTVGDDEWIARAHAEGWVALTKDPAIVRHHTPALERTTLSVFALPRADLRGDEMAHRFQANLNRIIARALKPKPAVWVVHEKRLELRWRR
ncbi:MAG: hypothetical protein AB7L13_24945 [Acidimicrobiia bacterium]